MGRFYLRPKIRKVARRSCSENIDIGAEVQSTDLAGPSIYFINRVFTQTQKAFLALGIVPNSIPFLPGVRSYELLSYSRVAALRGKYQN